MAVSTTDHAEICGSAPPVGPDGGVMVGTVGEQRLQHAYGTRDQALRFYSRQVLDHLNEAMRTFVERQVMVFVATAGADGTCDNTLRAGPAGFVRALGARHLVWPDYRGNGVHASLGNITENPHVGLLFVDFVDDVIGLHVNGRATIVDDAAMRAAHPHLPADPVPARRAARWVCVEVEEAYIHCSRHIPRLARPDPAAPRGGGKKSDYFVGAARATAEVPPPALVPAVVAGPAAAEIPARRGWRLFRRRARTPQP